MTLSHHFFCNFVDHGLPSAITCLGGKFHLVNSNSMADDESLDSAQVYRSRPCQVLQSSTSQLQPKC